MLRIDTYMILLSLGSTSTSDPLLNVLEECSLIPYLYIYSASWLVFVSGFFCISLYIFIENTLQWIGGSSNSFVCNLVDHVSDQVKKQFKNLEEVAEGDAQPEGETAAQGVEQTPVLSKDNIETSTKNITLIFLPSCFTLKS